MERIESEGNQGTSAGEIDRGELLGGDIHADLYKELVEQNPAGVVFQEVSIASAKALGQEKA